MVTSEKTSAHFRNWHLTKHTQDGARADAVQPEAPQAGSPAGSSFSGGVLTARSEKAPCWAPSPRSSTISSPTGRSATAGSCSAPRAAGSSSRPVRFELSGGLAERYDVWYRSCDSARLARLGERRRGHARRRVPAPRASPPSRSPSSRRACYGQWEIGQLVVFTLALTRHLGVHRRGLPARLPRDLPARGPALQHPLDRVPLVPDGPAVAGVSCEVDWSGPTIGKDVSFVSLYTVCVKLMLIKYPLKL